MLLRHMAAAALLVTAPVVAQDVELGDGENNWIRTEGTKHDGDTLVFPAALIDGNGWLVLHPFRDGKPVGDVVAGYAPLADGESQDIAVAVEPPPASGDRFIVMLHSDANDNGSFDFVFINEREVVDRAVFEGNRMIAHVYVVP